MSGQRFVIEPTIVGKNEWYEVNMDRWIVFPWVGAVYLPRRYVGLFQTMAQAEKAVEHMQTSPKIIEGGNQ